MAVAIASLATVVAPEVTRMSNEGSIAHDATFGASTGSASTDARDVHGARATTTVQVESGFWLERLEWPSLVAIAIALAAAVAALGVWWTRMLSRPRPESDSEARRH